MYLNNKSKEVYFKENQEYKRKRLKYTAIKEKQYPIFWRKVLTLKCYSKKSTRDCSINEMKPEMSIEQTLRTMRSWARVCDTYMFSLRNIVQVIFEDHSTIIYVMDENTLLYL